MNVGFNTIYDHIIPMEDFRLKWRFADERYNKLPNHHLEQLKPLDKEAALFLSAYISANELHHGTPFKKEFFHIIEKIKTIDGNETKQWLYQRGLAFSKLVFLSWQPEDAMIVPWKLLIKYFDSFYYSGTDDLTVFDQSLQWALLFYHEDEIFFGMKEPFKPNRNISV